MNEHDEPGRIGRFPQPGELWSLWDMLRLHADKFAAFSAWLSQNEIIYLNPISTDFVGAPAPSPLTEENLDRLLERLKRGRSLADEYSLHWTSRAVQLAIEAIGDPPATNRQMIANYTSDIRAKLGDIRSTFQHELGQYVFLMPNPKRIAYWNNAREVFGPDVWAKFSDAVPDIEGACNCFAFEQDAAAVYHLCRVMEWGLHAVGKCLGITIPKNGPNWSEVLTPIRKERLRRSDLPSGWPERTRFDQLYNLLDSVSSGWRNPSMHILNRYTPPEAETIFAAVVTFMRDLAQRMDQDGHPKA